MLCCSEPKRKKENKKIQSNDHQNGVQSEPQEKEDIVQGELIYINHNHEEVEVSQPPEQINASVFDVNDEADWGIGEVNFRQQVKEIQKYQNPLMVNKTVYSTTKLETKALPDFQAETQEIQFLQVRTPSQLKPKSIRSNPVQNDIYHTVQHVKSYSADPIHESESFIENCEEEEENNNEVDDDREFSEEEAKNAAIYRWAKENYQYCQDKTKRAETFQIIQSLEESRTETANKDGGKQCKNKKMIKTIRAIGKQILKEVGKKVLTGDFNLTQISFPIRAMIPKSALEKALQATCLFPLYINRAAMLTDPIERIKLTIVATVGNFYINCSFLKPLNPVLGETIEANYNDGTQLYAEQISHHPPMSYFLVLGPDNCYKFYGHYNYDAKAGLNSLTLKNRGTRYIQFKDGQLIEYNFASEEYSGSFWGPMKLEATGKMIFQDRANKITAEFNFDNVHWKPTDYFKGDIQVNGKRVSKIYGTYMGYINFDDKRYWDYSKVLPYQFNIKKSSLESDHMKRLDRRSLIKGQLELAQEQKEVLENKQRLDQNLRKSHQKEKHKEKKKKQE